MSKNILGIIVGVVALALIGGVLLMNNSKNDKSDTAANNAEHSQSMAHETQNAAPNNQPATGNSTEAQSTTKVEIKDYAFAPQTIKVKVGETVTWTNQDSVKHDVAPDSESADFAGSELLGKGESYSFTFKKAGSYSYHCSPHPYMKATVEVSE